VNRALISVALVLALGLAACGGGGTTDAAEPSAATEATDGEATTDGEALTIYSGRGEDLVAPLFEQFTADTGIPVEVKYADSSELALLIAEEGDRSPADIFFAQSPGSVGFLAEQGALSALDESVTSLVDEQYRAEDGTWVGVTARQRVLVYNSDELDESELPASVKDLTDPAFAGKVGVAPENGSFQDFITAFRAIEGDDAARAWLEAMAANDSPNYPKNSAIVEAVGRGEVPLGLVNHYYNAQALAEDPSLPSRNHVFPDGDLGALLLLTTASSLASTDQPDQANAFVEYLLSDAGQRYFADEAFEYPLVADIEPPADLPPLDSLAFPEYDFDDYGKGLQETVDMIADIGILSS
jgi:iron(III) transport system substrate-binding protein